MIKAGRDDVPLRLPKLNEKASHEWYQLTGQVLESRTEPGCVRVNVTLASAAEREPQSPLAPAYRLWIADNLVRDGELASALHAYDQVVECAKEAERLLDWLDPVPGALYHKAQTAALAGDTDTAIATYEDLGRHPSEDANPALQSGLLAEYAGQADRAADYYRRVARDKASTRSDDPRELARRALLRIQTPRTEFFERADQLVDTLADALDRRDVARLQRMVSTTHFAVGPMGGHTRFEDLELLNELYRDLALSTISVRRMLLGSGEKRYLVTSGWKGKWFNGDVVFIVTRSPRGWQWTGLALTQANDLWVERWRPAVIQTNQPLPFELLAPWPDGQCFKAGGLTQFVIEQAAVLAGGLIVGGILAFNFSRSCCGFGPRGFYYNQGSTHDEEDAFAIDFTRYRQYVPYDPESGGTPVLAARAGIVALALAGTPSGNSSASNTVHIVHPDPANPIYTNRFTTRYLHMEGPFKLSVSGMMPIYEGNRLGRMDDTGNSVLDHLHFSIHDRNLPYPNVPYGKSVRPTPLSGVRLEDGDSGVCVRSTNIERVGPKPMIEAQNFAGQNWLITPAALAVNDATPDIQNQKWLLLLSGVVIVDLKGHSGATWRRETLSIRPDLSSPLQFAISRHAIPTPPAGSFVTAFKVEQWVPYAALGSIFNQHESINSGFAVDIWRPNPFAVLQDALSSGTHTNVFNGIQVDVAIRDTDAWLYRVNYHVALLGKIVFGPLIIT